MQIPRIEYLRPAEDAAKHNRKKEYVNRETAHSADRQCAVSLSQNKNKNQSNTVSTITCKMRGNVKKNCVNFLQRKSVADERTAKRKTFFFHNKSEQ